MYDYAFNYIEFAFENINNNLRNEILLNIYFLIYISIC